MNRYAEWNELCDGFRDRSVCALNYAMAGMPWNSMISMADHDFRHIDVLP